MLMGIKDLHVNNHWEHVKGMKMKRDRLVLK